MLKLSKLTLFALAFLLSATTVKSQEKVFPGADESTPSRAQYFSWINNTNEGPTEEHTMINFRFFEWLKNTYGMQLDIYAFDAGAIDGAKFYGKVGSERFNKQFPEGFDNVYEKAKSLGFKLGVWGGPDGFGKTPEEAQARIDMMVKLCKEYEFELFKFDKVCGPLPLKHEDYFIKMMKECRKHSPDLILLNHRLGLQKALPYATTFLWEGVETYIDCHIWNPVTAPHHRAGSLFRGLSPNNSRLAEDHGVCISSCIDAWDDELILQAFNRNLILAPEIYGNPWLLNDAEFAKLARIFVLHRKYRDIMVNSTILPEEKYGFAAISRGDENTRLITLRNLTWTKKIYKIEVDKSIGLGDAKSFKIFEHHPNENFLGEYKNGEVAYVEVEPFRTSLVRVTAEKLNEIYVKGAEYHIVENVEGKDVKVKILKELGDNSKVTLHGVDADDFTATINGKPANSILTKAYDLKNKSSKLKQSWHRKVADLEEAEVPADALALYEATVFSADNNALEVRSLHRSGETKFKAVKEARDAFFTQKTFVDRGVCDKYMFDGDKETSFYVSRRRHKEMRIHEGCLRVDFGKDINADKLVLNYGDVYALQPLEIEEGIYAYFSNDLQNWEPVIGWIGEDITIPFPEKNYRYMKIPDYPNRVQELTAYKKGKALDRSAWRASNLFANYERVEPKSAWKSTFKLDEITEGAFLCVTVEGEHGNEGAYAALKIDGKYVGAPDRSISYPANTFEGAVCHKNVVTKNYTYYIPLEKWMEGKNIEAHVLVNSDATELSPKVWLTNHHKPMVEYELILKRK